MPALHCTALAASANELEDVIYKHDGTILRGTLIEQDFEGKRYKIQLAGGSVFVVEQDDISKISKEAPLHPDIPAHNQIHHIANTNYVSPNSNSSRSLNSNKTFFIGPFGHHRDQPYEESNSTASNDKHIYSEVFGGTQIGFQHILHPNFAMIYTLSSAKFKKVIIKDDSTREDLYTLEPSHKISFLGKQITGIWSTNLYNNWRFFIGGGVFHNDYKQDAGDESLYGLMANLGMGYSWEHLQLMLQVGGDINNNDKDTDYSVGDFSLTLGFNF